MGIPSVLAKIVATKQEEIEAGRRFVSHDELRAKAADLPRGAIVFEAQMDAGLARQAYWEGPEPGTMVWVVESRRKQGWNRFTEHLYRRTG